MAGIGFELRQILSRPGYLNLFRAYGYAALIGSGPWVFSIVSLAVLGLVFRGETTEAEQRLFFLSVTYVYGFSLILSGPVQMVLTRYTADMDFQSRKERIFPAIATILALASVVSSAIGLTVFLGFVPGPMIFQYSAAAFFVLVTCIWITSIYLTAVKNYKAVLISFFSGYGASFLAAWGATAFFGAAYTMLGMVVGHMVLLVLLLGTLFQEIGATSLKNSEVFGYFKKFLVLALCGFFYNTGIWIDKILFWFFSPDRIQVSGWLYASPIYDQVVYLSFLTVVPGMAIFLLKLETDFAINYAEFTRQVLGRATFDQIHQIKESLVVALQEGLTQLVKIQGTVTVLLILFASRMLKHFGLGAVQIGVFQIVTVGVFLLVLFLSLMTVLFYLGKLHDAMYCCLAFAVINAGVTAWSIFLGERWYGFGFLFSSAVATTLSTFRVNYHLQHLEYDTFTSQTIL